MSDDAKRAILARRARFVTAALASAGLVVSTANCGGDTEKDRGDAASGGNGGTPQPCLSPPQSGGTGGVPAPCLGQPAGGYGGSGGEPQPCLSGAGGWLPEEDASADAADADADDAAGGD